nr:glutamine synthetase type III [Bacteroidales bacterium]
GKALNVAVMDTLKPIIASVLDVVCFDGNGYTEEWKQEAIRRGLDVETSVPEMFKSFTTPDSVKMFTSTGVYTEKELLARNEVKWEMYTKKVQIESRVMVRMALNHVIPAALEYKSRLLREIAASQEVFGSLDGCSTEVELVKKISTLVNDIYAQCDEMVEARKTANHIVDEYEKAVAYHGIADMLFKLRRPIDKLEEVVDNKLWPLPKYRELLFIS